ncbi:undecaprenyldiphospho-muramoylpentapeptide beta-N-acetylglucosaminyltransferase [Pelobacter propionicus]|uniref:UDP-N-acetylglucosamine--N-acetylmuramyl-(pentapeptide) pyrophosphoryl-undecaprenol N-acetylglucosamine transferase n=1 Tax=Pelobacter propionicus (strain DSM 2379 / NBRC 103807 / OttBd1) TaxID=338966 RepID=MURG_PELPD|nr:undecaprenyldiphospho-muramoylpentapeptide beta-N-acetylglucosaminyltransferase [Pelobacter propionicus]A1AU61.1 RecName: Full=UDP-N-acetylglucosamine--N-acetylmuramyl-(pentapeptide) pyrophosphoryl-undecaprenol N-acetylglucosamine transferase; AltName: Full=Undecaprenyl-PP-MurNAc-pentapeptide-UDPGlcNAc GlcNAc transferase [Pelobacter propionicus DSM 2379]ABL00882.1 UDP-N-acetylglucosamine--N-acetylmuramyl-(pentapeptide) pyrophosphoryl-undecaprenol N-acetylglucosamine transferase [Pelobacter pro
MKLIIAGGGTGGHLFPGIAVAEEFLSRDPANQVLFVGTERGIEARAVPAAGFPLELISAAGIRGKGGLGKLRGAAMMFNGYRQSCRLLDRFRPDAVLGVGGYASLPMLLAARTRQVPSFIHEQNAVPGMTNRLLSRFADRIFITLEESSRFFAGRRTLLTGNPLRRQILDRLGTRDQGPGIRDQEKHMTDSTGPASRVPGPRFNLLVFGGSQGAHAINMAMVAALPLLKRASVRLGITHQTGESDRERVAAAYRSAGVEARVLPFIADMASEYARADLVVCRAGATTIAEVTALAKACLFIPFPYAVDDHQRRNAEALLRQSACFMLLERELSAERLAALILQLAGDPRLVRRTGELAFSMARLDAARIIVDEILTPTN